MYAVRAVAPILVNGEALKYRRVASDRNGKERPYSLRAYPGITGISKKIRAETKLMFMAQNEFVYTVDLGKRDRFTQQNDNVMRNLRGFGVQRLLCMYKLTQRHTNTLPFGTITWQRADKPRCTLVAPSLVFSSKGTYVWSNAMRTIF